MSNLTFQKPDNVVQIEEDNFFGKFEFHPLEPGYGITIGNALRRVLLSSLRGFAITSVKIKGVNHEFATIPGVIEDVTGIILNLKQIRFKRIIEEYDTETANISITGKEVCTAGDLGKVLHAFEVLNPELVICNMDKKTNLQMEVTINQGRGYISADQNHEMLNIEDVNVIAIDSIFTPIRNVKYQVENYRIEQKTDYEKLILEIQTDGSIPPREALRKAAKILIDHFTVFTDDNKIMKDTTSADNMEEFDEDILHMRQLLKRPLTDMGLSVRALNCLKAADIEMLGQLVAYQKSDLLKLRNFGKKSLAELETLMDKLHLQFGMDVSKYKLDKE